MPNCFGVLSIIGLTHSHRRYDPTRDGDSDSDTEDTDSDSVDSGDGAGTFIHH